MIDDNPLRVLLRFAYIFPVDLSTSDSTSVLVFFLSFFLFLCLSNSPLEILAADKTAGRVAMLLPSRRDLVEGNAGEREIIVAADPLVFLTVSICRQADV